VDQRRAGGVRAPRGGREGDQAGADADVQRRLAAAGEGRPADPLAAYPRGDEAAWRRGQAHLLPRPGRDLGRPVGAGAGADPRGRPARPARGANAPRLGRVRLARPRPVDQPARQPRERGDPGADRGRGRGRRPRVRGSQNRPVRHPRDGRRGLGPAGARGRVRAVRGRVPRARGAGRRAAPSARAGARLAALPGPRPVAAARAAAAAMDRDPRGRTVRRPAPAVAAGRASRVAPAEHCVIPACRRALEAVSSRSPPRACGRCLLPRRSVAALPHSSVRRQRRALWLGGRGKYSTNS
jgi:hypothetical protein